MENLSYATNIPFNVATRLQEGVSSMPDCRTSSMEVDCPAPCSLAGQRQRSNAVNTYGDAYHSASSCHRRSRSIFQAEKGRECGFGPNAMGALGVQAGLRQQFQRGIEIRSTSPSPQPTRMLTFSCVDDLTFPQEKSRSASLKRPLSDSTIDSVTFSADSLSSQAKRKRTSR
jgi:hypothetical protein